MIRKTLLTTVILNFIATVLFICADIAYSASVCGKTYPIAEPDLLEEAHKKAENLMKDKAYIAALRKKLKNEALNYRPQDMKKLPPSVKSFSYKYDVVYTLPFDIPRVDRQGKVIGILYPRGFIFHVMRYIPYFRTLVVFDIKNTIEKKWVIKHYGDNFTVILLSVGGEAKDLLDMAKQIKRPVYFDVDKLNERLNVKYTVSIVTKDKSNPDLVDIRVVGLNEMRRDLKKGVKGNAEKAFADKKHK